MTKWLTCQIATVKLLTLYTDHRIDGDYYTMLVVAKWKHTPKFIQFASLQKNLDGSKLPLPSFKRRPPLLQLLTNK